MKVKYIAKRASLPLKILTVYPSEEQFSLEINSEYTVYAITVRDEYTWYCILESNSNSFPLWNPSLLFEIIDPRPSKYWICSSRNDKKNLFISFPEWANSEYFYSRLSDDYYEEIETFKRYRTAMDLEFPDKSLFTAQMGDDLWLICPKCMDAWKHPDDKEALVVCPKCKEKYNNPRYKNEFPILK